MCFAVKRPLNAAKMLLCGYVVWKQSMAGATSRKIGSVGLTIGAPGNENPRHTCCTTGGFHVLQKPNYMLLSRILPFPEQVMLAATGDASRQRGM
jgi:hypothetical protein